LQVEGASTSDIVLRGNSLARARQPLWLAGDVPPDAVLHDEPMSQKEQ
jgi:hypothetical protein